MRINIGDKFGVLTVTEKIKYTSKNGRVRTKYKCYCDTCRQYHTVFSCALHENRICSFEPKRKTHGLSHTPLYNIWYGIKQRCNYKKNSSYKYYGGRGIKMCNEWKDSFQAFYKWAVDNGYKDNLTIDRIDVNGNYEPNNCRWVDWKTQGNNKTNNVYFTWNDETLSLKQWCEKLNLNYKTVMTRYYRGHKIEMCLELIPFDDTRKSKFYTINGITKTAREWARYYNINENTVLSRLRRGKSIVQALRLER